MAVLTRDAKLGFHVTCHHCLVIGYDLLIELLIVSSYLLFPPLSMYFLIFCSFLLFPFSFFHSLYLFSSFVHPSHFYHYIPLLFQTGGRRRRLQEPGFSLLRSFCLICIAYLRFILVFCCIWFILQCDSCLPLS